MNYHVRLGTEANGELIYGPSFTKLAPRNIVSAAERIRAHIDAHYPDAWLLAEVYEGRGPNGLPDWEIYL